MTTLTVVTFEPETVGLYIDGDLYDRGESYMIGRMLREIIESDLKIDNTETDHAYPESWEGMPRTLDELQETYDTE